MRKHSTDYTDNELEQIGQSIVEELQLKRNKKRRYNTIGGDKTPIGLARTIMRVIEEQGETTERK